MPEIITSKDNRKIKEAISYRDGKGEFFLVEGFHMVEMALSSGSARRVFSLKQYDTKGVDFYLVNEAVMKKLTTSKNPEGIVALCKKKQPKEMTGKAILYLDELQDPGNVGTLLRTALAFGYPDVILSQGTASAYSSKTLSSSQGAIFFLNVKESGFSPEEDIKTLKKEGYWILATDLRSSVPLQGLSVPSNFVLILGNEGKGVNPKLLSLSDERVRIEMEGIDSLNVGVAGGILLYELRKQGE